MSNLFEFRSAIPSTEVMSNLAFQQGEQILNRIHSLTQDDDKSHRLYVALEKKLQSGDPLYKTPFTIEFYKGLKIPVYMYLYHYKKNGRVSPRGSFGAKKQFLTLPIARLTFGLQGDPDTQLVYWQDNYEEIMTHEITHLFQALDVAIRYLKQKRQRIDLASIDKTLALVSSRKGSSLKLKDKEKSTPEEKIDKEIAYHKVSSEIGANAHALIKFLYKKYGVDAIEDIVNCVEKGRPTFKDIDNAIRAADRQGRTVWGSYDKLIDLERTYKGISRDEWTEGYQLKKTLLKVASEFYKRHYK